MNGMNGKVLMELGKQKRIELIYRIIQNMIENGQREYDRERVENMIENGWREYDRERVLQRMSKENNNKAHAEINYQNQ